MCQLASVAEFQNLAKWSPQANFTSALVLTSKHMQLIISDSWKSYSSLSCNFGLRKKQGRKSMQNSGHKRHLAILLSSEASCCICLYISALSSYWIIVHVCLLEAQGESVGYSQSHVTGRGQRMEQPPTFWATTSPIETHGEIFFPEFFFYLQPNGWYTIFFNMIFLSQILPDIVHFIPFGSVFELAKVLHC